jgi:hypothetical protein
MAPAEGGGHLISHRVLAAGQIAAVLLAVAAIPAGARLFWPREATVAPAANRPLTGATDAVRPPDSLEQKVIARDPFRPSHRPTGVAYDPSPAPPTPVAPPPPKPALMLTGIVWGRDPAAVLEGVPGVDDARLVREGEELAGFRVRRITAQKVTVTGMDTTWVLEVRRPW